MLFSTNPGSRHSTIQQLYGYLPPISQTIKDKQDMMGIASVVRTNIQ